MNLRRVFFWLHLTTGSLAGIVILVMSFTGVLLMYEKQIVAWADQREYRSVPPSPGAARLPLEALLAKVRETPAGLPATVTVRADPTAPVALGYGPQRFVYVNPYSGEVMGAGSPRVRAFFRAVMDWHRWLGAAGENRPTGRAVTGACNLAFLLLVMSGFYLWWPRNWTWPNLRPVTWFRGGLAGKARDFNWHNVFGFWTAVPLFFIVLSGAVISYPWAGNLVYRLTGSEPPVTRAAERPGEVTDLSLDGLDQLWSRAEQQVSGWQTISLRLASSNGAPLTFTIDQGTAGQPQKRAFLTLDRRTGAVERWEPFSGYNLGRRARSWLRFVHTGEYYGAVGQTIAGIASAAGVMLVWTGLSLAWRRFWGWRVRRRPTARTASTTATPCPSADWTPPTPPEYETGRPGAAS